MLRSDLSKLEHMKEVEEQEDQKIAYQQMSLKTRKFKGPLGNNKAANNNSGQENQI